MGSQPDLAPGGAAFNRRRAAGSGAESRGRPGALLHLRRLDGCGILRIHFKRRLCKAAVRRNERRYCRVCTGLERTCGSDFAGSDLI